MIRKLALLTALAVCLASVAFSQDFPLLTGPENVRAVKFVSAPKIDGTVGADEWAGIGTIARSLIIGSTNVDSGEKGQMWIGYDDTYVYIAARIILQDPTNISADEYRDNASLRGNDAFQISLDTFGLGNDASEIEFNANGATSLEIAGGRAAKLEWSGRVEAAARTTATGWEGEVRIPWQLLPLPAEGVRDMRFEIEWYVTATGRDVSFHSTQGDPTKTHVLSGVQVPKVDQGSKILLLPYGYAGYNDENGEHIANGGLDLKTALTSDLVMVGTFNPDFRNIEGDVLDLDFSNFERLADESRPFFREGSDYMFFGHGRRIFASQRIDQFDMGFNLYGNIGGDTRVGFLSTIDFGEQATVAGSYTYNPDPNTEFTGSFAALQRAGEDNNAGRFAASKRVGLWNTFVTTNITDDEIIGQGTATSFGTFYNSPGWEANVMLVDVAGDFFPRIGFASETDFKGYRGSVTRELEYRTGTVSQLEIDFDFLDYERRSGGHYREGLDLGAEMTIDNKFELEVGTAYEHFEDRHDTLQSISLRYPQNNPYRNVRLDYEFGQIDNANYRSVGAGVNYRPIKRLQLGLRAQAVQHIEDEEQIVFSFSLEIGRYESFAGRAVLDDDHWNWFASYRLSGDFGAEYFIIVGDPNADSFQKTLILKVSIPLTIGG